MLALTLRFHRFLVAQSFYPIVLSTILALGIFVGRAVYGQTWSYSNLIWNLFLAWVPYVFSVIAASLHFLFPKQWWMLIVPGFFWLIFFPNAPYIVTDFLHLWHRPPIPLWYDIGLIATFAWTGCFLAIGSLKTMQYLVRKFLGRVASWLFAGGVLILTGFGIYLGRFGRWNSWDIFYQPQDILMDIAVRLAYPFNNLRFFVFTVMFTTFLSICYFMFVSITHLDELDRIETLQNKRRQV
jgi:uncharacterized membrane protein